MSGLPNVPLFGKRVHVCTRRSTEGGAEFSVKMLDSFVRATFALLATVALLAATLAKTLDSPRFVGNETKAKQEELSEPETEKRRVGLG